jgi:small ligand-binding sensory domain FIST
VLVCHRTIAAVRKGAAALAARVKEALAGRRASFALGYECGGRTGPFLGEDEACREAEEVRAVLGDDVPWLGMYAWGEIAPIGGRILFHQLTLPLCVIH